MIWLTWRQHRKQALYTVVGLAVLAALLVPTGLQMRSFASSSGLAACLRAAGTAQLVADSPHGCGRMQQAFTDRFGTFSVVAVLLLLLPLLIGLFFGAPVVAREVEQGTHRLVWTQGIDRRRWAAAKFGLLGGTAVLLAAVYALGVSWWIAPLASSGTGRMAYGYFDAQGVAPIAYTLFALALGTFAGSVWPKVLPAMAATLGGFVAVRVLVEVGLRPHYLAAKVLTYTVDSPVLANRSSGAWVLSEGVRNAAGKLVMGDGQIGCAGGPADPGSLCAQAGPGAYNWELYQPADRFWVFQGIESGIFAALAVGLVYLTVRRLRRIA
ncbi:hypothetical protein ACFW1A_23235 [Kitasatospora sp. NPDC058965]|uniref:hypothetical protein n=1 Tax=Kitasatospora sp. NPDC058965 TaxID=3346682 RepID=UPI0036A9B570